jgi:hypothetical protein
LQLLIIISVGSIPIHTHRLLGEDENLSGRSFHYTEEVEAAI